MRANKRENWIFEKDIKFAFFWLIFFHFFTGKLFFLRLGPLVGHSPSSLLKYCVVARFYHAAAFKFEIRVDWNRKGPRTHSHWRWHRRMTRAPVASHFSRFNASELIRSVSANMLAYPHSLSAATEQHEQQAGHGNTCLIKSLLTDRQERK